MVLLDSIKKEGVNPETSTVLSPDIGSAAISQGYAKHLGMHFALIDKRRYAPNKTEVSHLIGDLKSKDVLIIDDLIDTAGTIINATEAALDQGANSVSVVATHGVLSDPAIIKLQNANIRKIIITDTIQIKSNMELNNMEIVSVSNVFGSAINRIYKNESVSALFDV